MTLTKTQTRSRGRRNRPLWSAAVGAYRGLVLLSAIIVGGYLAYNLVIKPPDIGAVPPMDPSAEQTQGLKPGGSAGDQTGGVPSAPVRREGVYNLLLVGTDDGHGNADTIMVMSYDVTRQKVGVVSVPRDTLVRRSWAKYPKINGAYGHGGVELVRDEVSALLGIPIDRYVRVDLKAFVAIVNELGGIDYDVPEDMYHDDDAGFVIDLKKGQQHLDGHETLELVRYRTYQNGQADISRTMTQQKVLTALAKKALSLGTLTKIKPFLEIFETYVKTDLSPAEMIYFASQVLKLDTGTGVATMTLPGRGDGHYKGYSWCYELEHEATVAAVNEYLNPYTTPLTAEDMQLVKAERYG